MHPTGQPIMVLTHPRTVGMPYRVDVTDFSYIRFVFSLASHSYPRIIPNPLKFFGECAIITFTEGIEY